MFTRILPGIHLYGGGEPDPDQRRLAALLYAGPTGALTGTSALELHDLSTLRRRASDGRHERIHILVPQGRHVTSSGFVLIERTHIAFATRRKGEFVTTTIARATIDACRRMRIERTVCALIAEVVQRGLTNVADLEVELARASRRGSGFARHALKDVAAGTRSAPEADLRRGFVARGLAEPLWNATLLLPNGRHLCVPDAYFRECGVAVEVDSREHHLSPEDWDKTMRRHARMTAAGLVVLHFPPSRIRDELDEVIDEILAAVRAANGRTPPNVIVQSVAV